MKNIPKKIFLQVGEDCEADDFNDCFHEEMTRAADKVFKNDIEYILVESTPASPVQKEEAREAVDFADWKDSYLNSPDLPNGKLPNNVELYNLYKQSNH